MLDQNDNGDDERRKSLRLKRSRLDLRRAIQRSRVLEDAVEAHDRIRDRQRNGQSAQSVHEIHERRDIRDIPGTEDVRNVWDVQDAWTPTPPPRGRPPRRGS